MKVLANNWYTHDWTDVELKETPVGESLTQPQEVKTLRQILESHTRGFEVKGVAEFNEVPAEITELIPNFNTMDRAEQQMLLKEVRSNIRAIQKRRSEIDAEEKRKAEAIRIKEQMEFEEWKKNNDPKKGE